MPGAVAGASFAELDALVDNLLREGDLPSGASQAATSPPHEVNAAKPQQQSMKPELHPVATPQLLASPPTQTGLGAAVKTNSSADDVDALVDRILQDANVSPTLLAAPQRPPRGGAAALPSSSHNTAAQPTQSISPLPPSRFATRTTTAVAPHSTRRWPAAHNNSSKDNNNNTTSRSAHEEDELPSPQPRVLSARRAAANLHHYDINEDISFETPSHTLDSQARAQQLRRFRMWEARREARRVEAVYEALEKEQRECPFQPDTTAASLRRQILARCPQRRDGSKSKRSSSREGTSTRRQQRHRQASDEVGTTTADARRPYIPSPLPHTSITPRTRNSSSSSSSPSLVLHRHPTPPEGHKAAVNKKKSDDYEYREEEDDYSDTDDLLTSTRWHVPRHHQQPQQRGISASTVTTTTATSPSARARREKRRHAERHTSHSEDAWRAMLKPSPLYAENKAWGFDAYVSRMAAARALREQRRQAEAEEIARLVDPRFIHKGPTVPEPFALSASNAQNKTTATSEEEANNTVEAAKERETRTGDAGRGIRRAARLRLYAELAPQMRAEWLFSDAMEAALRHAAQRVSEDSEGNEDEG